MSVRHAGRGGALIVSISINIALAATLLLLLWPIALLCLSAAFAALWLAGVLLIFWPLIVAALRRPLRRRTQAAL
jgi:hypothetical protein